MVTSMEENKPEPRVEDDVTSETEWQPVASTDCDHYLVMAPGDPNSNLWSAQCNKCPHGANFDPQLFEIKEGKLVDKETE